MNGDKTAGAAASDIDGYVADSHYPSLYHPPFAPPWIDALLLRQVIRPPRGVGGTSGGSFTVLDLGCGDGLGLILNAATHPDAHFVGLDAMASHIERGQAFADALGLENVELRCATFKEALAHESVEADYVAAQGVLSWVNPANRAHLFDLIDRNLAPTGVAAIGYNCMPGWSQFLSLQKALLALATGETGTPTQRFDTAYARLRELSGAGVASVKDRHLEWMDDLREKLPADYFPHEYLNANWHPLWCSDAIEEARAHGLSFLRPAMAHRLREDFALTARQRDIVEGLDAGKQRELAIDLFLDSQFRIDIFARSTIASIEEDEAIAARMDGHWLLRSDCEKIDFSAAVPAGRIRFDNPAARAIAAGLNGGGATLDDIWSSQEICTRADILNAADAMFVANLITPVDAPDHSVDAERINAVMSEVHGAAGRPINALATAYGPVNPVFAPT